ncbi:MAG: hypothetical protein EOO73_31985 [Myxococcales bacterium]|nr:MAG: hypothetical protein EOO73_31985 [Myxococcales bacterium]
MRYSALLGLASLATLVACGSAAPEVVAREQRPTEVEVSVPTSRQRQRPRVVEGQLLTDRDTPLRGVLLPVDVGWYLADFELMTELSESTGINAVHVYLENYSHAPGAMQEAADALVALTAEAGLYLVLGIGGGSRNGSFTIEKVREFWTRYGARYGARTHVLFEIQNNPELNCDVPFEPETLALEREAYELIRGVAPDSHILLFSASSVPTAPVVEQGLSALSDSVDFTNTSFAMHTDEVCTPPARYDEVLSALAPFQVPMLISQLPDTGWEPVMRQAEALGIGWLHHQWLSEDQDLSTFRSALGSAKISWCPDQGTYPEPAESCR